MRILKFAGAFLATLIVVFLIIFGFNLDALFTLFQNQKGIKEGQEWVSKTKSLKGLTQYIGAQPKRVSIASFALANPDSSILYNTHTPRTMGRLSNIFLVIEYVRQVQKGTLNPNEQIPMKVVGRYQIPYMDASDHQHALGKLEKFQTQSDSTVALKYLVDASVAYNDIAISDYLLFKLGVNHVNQLLDELSINETEPPLPFCGIYIALNPHLQNRSTQAHFDSLSQLSRRAFSTLVFKKAKRFIHDDDFHRRVSEIFDDGQGLNIKFTRQRDGLAFFPKTTAYEMAGLMKKIQQELLLSPAISKKVKVILGWVRKNNRLEKDFKTYGAIYDNRMGMVNGIDFGASTYTGEPFAQAIFFDDLQVAFWFHMSSNLMHQDFEQRLIWDPSLRAATVREIHHPSISTPPGGS